MYFPASVFLNHHFSNSSETVSLRVFNWAQLGFSIRSLRQTRPCIWELQPWFIILQVGSHLDSTLIDLKDVHRLISSSVVTNIFSSLTSTAVFNRCPRLFVWTREFCFFFWCWQCLSSLLHFFSRLSGVCFCGLSWSTGRTGLFRLGRLYPLASLLPPPWREPRLVPHLRPASLSHCWDLNVCCFSWLQMAHPVGGGFMCSSFLPWCHLSLTS